LDLNVVGLIYTSPTLASASSNCIPVITFFIALLLRYIYSIIIAYQIKRFSILLLKQTLIDVRMWYFRIESLKIKTGAGIAKLVGNVACGAATLAFYKGPQLKL